jgi:hypothetical protein
MIGDSLMDCLCREVTLDERKGKSPPAKPTPTTPGPSDASTWDGITAPTCGTEKKVAAPVSKAAIEEKVPEPQSLQIAISAACAKPLSGTVNTSTEVVAAPINQYTLSSPVPSEVPPVETKQAQKSAQPTASTVFKDSRSKLQIRFVIFIVHLHTTKPCPSHPSRIGQRKLHSPPRLPNQQVPKSLLRFCICESLMSFDTDSSLRAEQKFDEDILFGSTTSGTDILSSLDDINIQMFVMFVYDMSNGKS